MKVHFDYSGASVVVTGASRGIGLAVARAYATAGADVLIISNGEEIPDVAAELTREHKRLIRGAAADITDVEQVRAAFDGMSKVDILVNNAGLELLTPVGDQTEAVVDDFRRIVDVNLTGMFLTTRAAVPLMVGEKPSIVNTASIWGRTSESGFSAYASSKHAVIGLTRTLALELAPRRIRVNAVCPGWVRTKASMKSIARMSMESGRPKEDLLAEATSRQLFPGLMEPEDIASAYMFLSSDAASNITGQSIMVDRGEVMA